MYMEHFVVVLILQSHGIRFLADFLFNPWTTVQDKKDQNKCSTLYYTIIAQLYPITDN